MRVLFALPGLHRYDRGAEVAFISVAKELAKAGAKVTLIGSGQARMGTPYHFLQAKSIARERFYSFPSVPLLRDDCSYEEFTFIPDFFRQYCPEDYDVTLTCSYPFTNWFLRRPTLRDRRPAHVFVTQNGDWPAWSNQSEYRFFGCEGLVCTNPDFYDRNRSHWHSKLIPNGVDCDRFKPGSTHRDFFKLPVNRLIVLMVSALIPSKRIDAGVDAVSRIPNAHLVVAGNGPQRQKIETIAARLLPDRFTLLSVPAARCRRYINPRMYFFTFPRRRHLETCFLKLWLAGLPVVAHDTPRTRWIIGDDQFLIDTDDSGAIVSGINDACNILLAKQSQRVAQAALFSWNKIGSMYQEFLQEIVG